MSLAKTLQDYIDSPDFEKSRLAYLEKKLGKSDTGRSEGKQSDLIDVFSSSFIPQQPAPTPNNNPTYAAQTFFQPPMASSGGNAMQMQPALVHQQSAGSMIAQQPMQMSSGPAMLPLVAGTYNQLSANSSIYAQSTQGMMLVQQQQQQQQQISRQGSQYSQQAPSMGYGFAAQQPYANATTSSFPAQQPASSFSQQSLPGSFNQPMAHSGQVMQAHQPNPFGNVPAHAGTIANPFAPSGQLPSGSLAASSYYQVSRQQSFASAGSGVNSFNPIFSAGAAVPNQSAPVKPTSTNNPFGTPNPQVLS